MKNIANKDNIFMIMQKHQLNCKKRYGQNFITNLKIVEKIVDNSEIDKETGIIEIGPGLGSLTEALANKARKIVAIEIDKKLSEILSEVIEEKENLKIINADFLKIDIDRLIEDEFKEFKKVKIISNLPYYITSSILEKILVSGSNKIDELVLMMQKEVGTKLIRKEEKPKIFLKFLVDYTCETKKVVDVSKNDFFPRPKVDSIVIKLKIKKEKEKNKELILFVKQLFANKRKALINNMFINKEEIISFLDDLNIKRNVRIEELTSEDIIKIATKIIQTNIINSR